MKKNISELKASYWEQSKGMLLLMLFISAFFLYFCMRYTFAYNGSISDCLNTRFFLVDSWDKDIKRGDLAAFRMEKDNMLFEKGLKWIKLVGAEGGDTVKVTYDDMTVNGNIHYNINLWYTLSKLKMDISEITPDVTLKPDELFMVGETPRSYDSRFWGPIQKKDIIGRAYAIF